MSIIFYTMNVEKDWYECTNCGYAFDWFDMSKHIVEKNQKKKRIKSICKNCDSLRMKKYFEFNRLSRILSNSNYRLKNKDKVRAWSKLQYGIKKGKIEKKPCIVCGSLKVHGHHEDYSKPLEVIWLCPLYHKNINNVFTCN